MPAYFRAQEKPEDIHGHVGGVQIVVQTDAAPLAQNESNLCQPSLYGNGERAVLLPEVPMICYKQPDGSNPRSSETGHE
jgi:hypothetical protein